MNKIHFHRDERGQAQVTDFLSDIVRRTKLSADNPEKLPPLLVSYIAMALEKLKYTEDFPYPYPLTREEEESGEYVTTLNIREGDNEGESIEMVLVKVLRQNGRVSYIYELRITYRDIAVIHQFRAIFFTITVNGENYYVFTKAFFKTRDTINNGGRIFDPTNIYLEEAIRIKRLYREKANYRNRQFNPS